MEVEVATGGGGEVDVGVVDWVGHLCLIEC